MFAVITYVPNTPPPEVGYDYSRWHYSKFISKIQERIACGLSEYQVGRLIFLVDGRTPATDIAIPALSGEYVGSLHRLVKDLGIETVVLKTPALTVLRIADIIGEQCSTIFVDEYMPYTVQELAYAVAAVVDATAEPNCIINELLKVVRAAEAGGVTSNARIPPVRTLASYE